MKITNVTIGTNAENRYELEREARVSFEDKRSGGVVFVRAMSTPEHVNVSGAIVVNGVEIRFSTTATSEGREAGYLNATRLETFTDITDAAKKYLREWVIPTAVAKAVEHPEFQIQQKATQLKYIGYDIDRARGEIKELEFKVNQKRQEIEDLQATQFQVETDLQVAASIG